MPRKKVNKKIDKKLERLLKEKKNIDNSTISIDKSKTNTKKSSKRKKDEIIVPERNIKKSRKKDTVVVKERKRTSTNRKRSLTISETEKEKLENKSFEGKQIDEDSRRAAEFEKEMQMLYDKIDSSDYTTIIDQESNKDEISNNEKEDIKEKLKEDITDAKIRNINDDIMPKKKINILKIITIILAILFIILLIAFFLFIYYVCTY